MVIMGGGVVGLTAGLWNYVGSILCSQVNGSNQIRCFIIVCGGSVSKCNTCEVGRNGPELDRANARYDH